MLVNNISACVYIVCMNCSMPVFIFVLLCVSVCVPVVSDRLCPGGEQRRDGLLCLLNHC